MKIVTGMHRSGTSLIANLIFTLGVGMGDPELFLKGNQWNKKGYFENKYIIDLNNRLIIGDWAGIDYWIAANEQHNWRMGLVWNLGKLRYLWLPGQTEINQRADTTMKDEVARLAAEHAQHTLKDTRFSLTLPAWIKHGKVESILYVYRHPRAVAGSLQKRDNLPYFISYRLWAQFVQRFFDNASGQKVIMVDYDRFFQPETRQEELQRLLRFLDIPYSDKVEDVVRQVLDYDMRHNQGEDENLPGNVRRIYTRLHEYHAVYGELKPFTP